MIRFCTQCGAAVTMTTPPGDALVRPVCTACQHIHYDNPRLIVGCVAEYHSEILLCRRAIEPQYGLWTLPAGFMENGETTAEGAARETIEESGATVYGLSPFAMVSVPHINQVHLFYRGTLRARHHPPGPESLEAALFPSEQIPWESLAFSSVRFCLTRYLADRAEDRFSFHEATLTPDYRIQSALSI